MMHYFKIVIELLKRWLRRQPAQPPPDAMGVREPVGVGPRRPLAGAVALAEPEDDL